MAIDYQELSMCMLDCLFKSEELPDDRTPPDDAVMVKGVMRSFGFHPGRLETHRDQVRGWLEQLPHTFREDIESGGGGGWSFLNGCMLENGEQWGEQPDVEELFALGQALGMVKCQIPPELWGALPGGVPYYSINLDGKRE